MDYVENVAIQNHGEFGRGRTWYCLWPPHSGQEVRHLDLLVKEGAEIELHPSNMKPTRQVLFLHFMISSVAIPEANKTVVFQRWENHPPEVTLPFLFLHK